MGTKFEMDISSVIGRFSPKFKKSQEWLDNEVLKDCDKYVPMRTGNLKSSGIRGTTLGEGKIVYNAPYARKCYYAKRASFSKEHHPNACAQWFEAAKAVFKKLWISGAKKIMKE